MRRHRARSSLGFFTNSGPLLTVGKGPPRLATLHHVLVLVRTYSNRPLANAILRLRQRIPSNPQIFYCHGLDRDTPMKTRFRQKGSPVACGAAASYAPTVLRPSNPHPSRYCRRHPYFGLDSIHPRCAQPMPAIITPLVAAVQLLAAASVQHARSKRSR